MSAGFEVDDTSWDDFLAGVRAEADELRTQRLIASDLAGSTSPGAAPPAVRWRENLTASRPTPAPTKTTFPVDAQAAAERYRLAAGEVSAMLAQLERSADR
ncbi:MAG: hypothetical protein ACT4PP_14070 [Sporichthyaceae bacterium]